MREETGDKVDGSLRGMDLLEDREEEEGGLWQHNFGMGWERRGQDGWEPSAPPPLD